jgi:predicted acyl esterase
MCLFLKCFSKQRTCLAAKKLVILILVWGLLSACDNVFLDVEIPMSDGTHLLTDFYLPTTRKPREKISTLLIRTPYEKENLASLGPFAENGYAVAIQDMRMSRKGSADDFLFFRSDGWKDHQDGYDTLEYCRNSLWSNGRVATYGSSALGIVQYLLAGTGPEGLSGQFIAIAAPDLYEDFFFPGGAFRKNDVELWIRNQGFSNSEQDSIIEREIYSHRIKDEYWESVDLTNRLDYIKAPAFHLGGWFDLFSTGTIKAYKIYRDAGVEHNYLVMGPWTHTGIELGYTLPNETVFQINGIVYWPASWSLRWGKDPGAVFLDKAILNDLNSFDWFPVTYYVMGTIDPLEQPAPGLWWCYADDWPPPEGSKHTYYLQNDFLLKTTIPPSQELSYGYDPHSPVPTICGRFYDPQYCGFCDVHAFYDDRTDLLYFETEALVHPVEVTGEILLHLKITSNRTDTDFVAFLVDVYPNGSKMLITEGIMRARFRKGFHQEVSLSPGEPHYLTIPLGSTSMIFNVGHKIGLYVSSSNYPGFETNLNTGENSETGSDSLVATNTIITGEKTALILPVYEKFSCNPFMQNLQTKK